MPSFEVRIWKGGDDTVNEHIATLKQMRAELMQRIDALDSAIRIMEQVSAELTPTVTLSGMPQPKPRKRAAKSAPFDITKIPDYNPHGGGIRTDI